MAAHRPGIRLDAPDGRDAVELWHGVIDHDHIW
jgi:hypothetical protein